MGSGFKATLPASSFPTCFPLAPCGRGARGEGLFGSPASRNPTPDSRRKTPDASGEGFRMRKVSRHAIRRRTPDARPQTLQRGASLRRAQSSRGEETGMGLRGFWSNSPLATQNSPLDSPRTPHVARFTRLNPKSKIENPKLAIPKSKRAAFRTPYVFPPDFGRETLLSGPTLKSQIVISSLLLAEIRVLHLRSIV